MTLTARRSLWRDRCRLSAVSSRRTVPLHRVTADLLAGYLAEHPHADIQSAPLFPDLALIPPSRAGIAYGPLKLKRRNATREPWRQAARRQATALAELTLPEHAARLLLDWGTRCSTSVSIAACFSLPQCGQGCHRP